MSFGALSGSAQNACPRKRRQTFFRRSRAYTRKPDYCHALFASKPDSRSRHALGTPHREPLW